MIVWSLGQLKDKGAGDTKALPRFCLDGKEVTRDELNLPVRMSRKPEKFGGAQKLEVSGNLAEGTYCLSVWVQPDKTRNFMKI